LHDPRRSATFGRRNVEGVVMNHALKGIGYTALFTLLLAMLSAALFRFPIPFVGVVGPFGEFHRLGLGMRIYDSAFAWVFYSVLSGGLVQLVGGAAVGVIAGACAREPGAENRAIATGSLLLSLVAVLGLATLDWFIGPW
jgi:hypothetical protein